MQQSGILQDQICIEKKKALIKSFITWPVEGTISSIPILKYTRAKRAFIKNPTKKVNAKK